MPNRKQNVATNLVAASIIALMLFLSSSNAATDCGGGDPTTKNDCNFDAKAARYQRWNPVSELGAGAWPVDTHREHICDDDCTVNCIGGDSCTYRRFTCGTGDGSPVNCTVLCDWDAISTWSGKGNKADMHYWTGKGDEFMGVGEVSPYPPCNQAEFTVKSNSHLTLRGVGQGALMLVKVLAEEGSTVSMDVRADWGLMWADIDAKYADELDITVQGEAILWDADIICPAASTGEPNCRITLETNLSEVNDFNLDYYYSGVLDNNDYDEFDLYAWDSSHGNHYNLWNKFNGEDKGFVTALMTGTHIVTDDLAKVEVNCEGPGALREYLFSDVDDKPSQLRGDDRSRRPQIQGRDSGAICPLELTLEPVMALGCNDGVWKSVRGTCSPNSLTKSPTTGSPTKSPTKSPTTAECGAFNTAYDAYFARAEADQPNPDDYEPEREQSLEYLAALEVARCNAIIESDLCVAANAGPLCSGVELEECDSDYGTDGCQDFNGPEGLCFTCGCEDNGEDGNPDWDCEPESKSGCKGWWKSIISMWRYISKRRRHRHRRH